MADYTLVCDDDFDGIMTAIYDGWGLMNKGHNIHIHPGKLYEYNFLTEYVYVQTDYDKSFKVVRSVRDKISTESYMIIYRACMHYDECRADAAMEYMKIGFKNGARVNRDYGNPTVLRVAGLARKVANEVHLYKGFIRFKDIDGRMLVSKIAPKCDVLTLLAYHFETRFPLENWVIYDEVRKKALFHKSGSDAIIVTDESLGEKIRSMNSDDEYEDLWKIFFNTIAIESRKNEKCQRNNLPKWFRDNMTEFESDVK